MAILRVTRSHKSNKKILCVEGIKSYQAISYLISMNILKQALIIAMVFLTHNSLNLNEIADDLEDLPCQNSADTLPVFICAHVWSCPTTHRVVNTQCYPHCTGIRPGSLISHHNMRVTEIRQTTGGYYSVVLQGDCRVEVWLDCQRILWRTAYCGDPYIVATRI